MSSNPGSSLTDQLFAAIEGAENGIETKDLCYRFGATVQELGEPFEQLKLRGTVLGLAGHWVSREVAERWAATFVAALSAANLASPKDLGAMPTEIAKSAGIRLKPKPLDRFVSWLESERRLRRVHELVRIPEIPLQISPRQTELLDRIESVMPSGSVAQAVDIARELGVPVQVIVEIWMIGDLAGRIVRLEEHLALLPQAYSLARERLCTEFGTREFTASEARIALETNRKFIIPLLERMEADAVTERTETGHRLLRN